MNKAREALDNLYFNLKSNDYYLGDEATDDYILIEKSLKALDIIKRARVNVEWLLETENVEEYNESLYDNLTQEEYDLLKEVML